MWLTRQLQHSLLADNRGQGYTEYVVLLAAVLAIAGIIVTLSLIHI